MQFTGTHKFHNDKRPTVHFCVISDSLSVVIFFSDTHRFTHMLTNTYFLHPVIGVPLLQVQVKCFGLWMATSRALLLSYSITNRHLVSNAGLCFTRLIFKLHQMFSFTANGPNLPLVQSERVQALGKAKRLCQVSVYCTVVSLYQLHRVQCTVSNCSE